MTTIKLLAPQREKFAQLVGSGKATSASAAYREAYPTSIKWPDKTVHSAASALMVNKEVLRRVAEIRTRTADAAGLDADRIIIKPVY